MPRPLPAERYPAVPPDTGALLTGKDIERVGKIALPAAVMAGAILLAPEIALALAIPKTVAVIGACAVANTAITAANGGNLLDGAVLGAGVGTLFALLLSLATVLAYDVTTAWAVLSYCMSIVLVAQVVEIMYVV